MSDEISFAVFATAFFVIQRFGAVAVSQASSNITDGIIGLPTFHTGLIATL
jgi:hypothetical protein